MHRNFVRLYIISHPIVIARERWKNKQKLKKEGNVTKKKETDRGICDMRESDISGRKKKSRLGNINQTLHLVGSHMVEQHADHANLLILSNGVQLIPLAASIST